MAEPKQIKSSLDISTTTVELENSLAEEHLDDIHQIGTVPNGHVLRLVSSIVLSSS